MNRALLVSAAAALGFAIVATPTVARAQTTSPPQPAPAPAPQPVGLDALTDDKLINDLANRGLTKLLDRAFEQNKVPPGQRDATRALVALQRLKDPKLTLRQREELIPQIVKGVEQALPTMDDPAMLNERAKELLTYGVYREASLLEYWGETARSQVPLRPTVEAVLKMFDRAAELAQQRADAIANAITGPNDPRAQQWERLANLAAEAKYTRHMADYYLALSMDRVAASQQRKEVAAKAAEYLLQFDNADSTVQPQVRIQVAKLHMVREEFEQAKEAFASVIDGAGIEPAPEISQQWEARYFSAVSDLLAGNVEAAQQALNDLIAWQSGNLPRDKQAQDDAAAAAAMLQYRIHSLVAEKSSSPEGRQKANEQAVAVLLELLNKRPDLRTVIFRQLIARLPGDVDLKALDLLLVQGFVVRADEERMRPEGEEVDKAALQRGVEAAREILRRRKAGQSVDPQTADADALLLGFFLMRLDQKAAAAHAFLDYIADFGGNLQNATLALDNALALVGQLRAEESTASDPTTLKAYRRVLPVAINPPFSRDAFAYEYARLLLDDDKPREALTYFRMVPQDDPRFANARYYEMVSLRQRLDEEKLAPAERQQIVAEVLRMVDDVAQRLTAGMNAPGASEQDRTRYRSMLVSTTLLAADVARREQNDPKRTLQLLEQFESLASGLPNEKDLIGSVLYTRVQAFMELGDSNAATQTLVKLLKATPGGEGAAIVYKLLEKLNDELDAARVAGQRERMKTLARNRAQLSGFLVEWARGNADPNISRYTYSYSVFDAATKHLAADLEDDPAARKAGLEKALELYRQLESPESTELYRATLDASSPERNSPDPAVSLGIGLIAYDLGDFAEAQRRLGKLLTDRRLGTPTLATQDTAGQTKVVENDQYWEATLKLMRSNIALAAANPADTTAQAARTETINHLKQLYVLWGRDVGGKRWSPEFEKLRAEVAPNFNPDDVAVGPTP